MHAAPGAREVHLWKAGLDVPSDVAQRFARTLSPAESERAARLRGPVARARYAAAHGWLRQLLAAYLGTDPGVLTLTEDGKPRLLAPAAPWLRFNMSHSDAIVTIAVTSDRAVGVDVERERHTVDIDAVARRFFTAEQRAALAVTAPTERTRQFFSIWVRHEAYLKATGTGLAGAALPRPVSGWTIRGFDAGPSYAAAVAVEGDDLDVPTAPATLD